MHLHTKNGYEIDKETYEELMGYNKDALVKLLIPISKDLKNKNKEIDSLKKQLDEAVKVIESLLEYEENQDVDDIPCAVYDIFLINRKTISREFLQKIKVDEI